MTPLFTLILCAGIHQFPPLSEDPEPGLILRFNKNADAFLEKACEYLAEKNWRDALRILQTVLDDENSLYETKTKKIRDAHLEAERLLAGLPKRARDLYEWTYGPRALALLKLADDRETLSRIVQRYRTTRAGAVALKKLTLPKETSPLQPSSTKSGQTMPIPSWSHSLFDHKIAKGYLDETIKHCRAARFPVIPSAPPLFVSLRKGKQEQILVVYRNASGLEARKILSGELLWKAPHTDWSHTRMVTKTESKRIFHNWINRNRHRGPRPDLLFANSTVHRLSTDGRRIYTIEDFVLPPVPTDDPFSEEFDRMTEKMEAALKFNQLQAYDPESGKIQWEISNPDGLHYLSPPLPLGEELYVMAQLNQKLQLLTIDSKTGKQLQATTLGVSALTIEKDNFRRWNAHSLIRHGDLMICLTNLGHVIAVDLMTQKPRWIYRYKMTRKGLPWWNARPVIHGDRLLLTMPDDVNHLHCLNVKTGKLLWKRPVSSTTLYLAGVHNSKAILIRKNECLTVDLKDGTTIKRLTVGDVCGVGTFANGRYFLPLSRGLRSKKPELCEVDFVRGKIRTAMPLLKSMGNVVFRRDRLLSLGVEEIRSYALIDERLATLDRLLKKKPNDASLRRERGTVRFHLGELESAIEDLKVAKKNLKGAEQEKVEQTLVEAMLRLMDRDFQKGRKHLKECERLCRNPTIAEAKLKTVVKRKRLGEFYFMLGRARESQKRYQEAITAYFRAANYFDDKKLIESPEHPALKQTVQTWLMSRMKRIRLLMSQK